MTGREWKPGDVLTNESGERWVVVTDSNGRLCTAGKWGLVPIYMQGINGRALVVIDPEDAEAVERLADLLRRRVMSVLTDGDMQTALREFANPKPPKPDEPTGLGAVVIDTEGRHYIRCEAGRTRWHCADDDYGDHDNYYEDIDAVKVLSEGVQS